MKKGKAEEVAEELGRHRHATYSAMAGMDDKAIIRAFREWLNAVEARQKLEALIAHGDEGDPKLRLLLNDAAEMLDHDGTSTESLSGVWTAAVLEEPELWSFADNDLFAGAEMEKILDEEDRQRIEKTGLVGTQILSIARVRRSFLESGGWRPESEPVTDRMVWILLSARRWPDPVKRVRFVMASFTPLLDGGRITDEEIAEAVAVISDVRAGRRKTGAAGRKWTKLSVFFRKAGILACAPDTIKAAYDALSKAVREANQKRRAILDAIDDLSIPASQGNHEG